MVVVKLMEFFDRRVGGQETFGRKLCGVGRPSHNRVALRKQLAWELSIEECLTTLTPVRVALRVPRRHGLFSVFPKNLEITKRTQLKNAEMFWNE